MGSVEKIGIKTTRIRSLSGEQLIFANSDLLSSRIKNYKRMSERRMLFNIGVTYQTPHSKVKAIPQMIKDIIANIDGVRFDRAHFTSFGDSALLFEIVYYVSVPDMTTAMDKQEAINLELMKKFEENEIEFAYPTQTIFLEQTGQTENGKDST
mgnify:CR=1 FL=1